MDYTDPTPMAPASGQDGRSTVLLLTVRRLPAVCAIVTLCLTTPSSAQSPQPAAASPFDAAARALNFGRYEEVQSVLRNSTDPRAIALRARAEIAQGRYAEAEKLLAGPAESAPGSDAALELGLLQLRVGRRADATRTLQGVLTRSPRTTPQDLTRLGLAARALGRFQDANGFLRDASAQAPDDPVVNTAWGELFLEKYNRADAMKSFQAALRIDQDHVPARVGLARVLLEENPPAAQQAVDRALQTNPSYVPAHLFVAELALDDRRRDEARESIAKALAANPNSLEARALDAAIAFLEGRTSDFETRAKEILAINPLYGDAYRVAGDHAARNYRFTEAAELTRRALAVDKESTRSYADLGLHLLRTGDEPAARRSLETAFSADPFDVVTYNLLQMMDTLDKFETITEGDIVMRLHPDEAAVMREFAMPLAQQALATLSKQYQFKPQGPILIEMFPKHDDFAVRTLGLPGMIGALGACFGRVVTLDSPQGAAARPVLVGGNAVARDGACHHAADVEQSAAALAERRHVGVRRAARAAELGTRSRALVRAGAAGGQHAQAGGSQRRVHRPAHDLAGLLPGVAPRRASDCDIRRARVPHVHQVVRQGPRERGSDQGGVWRQHRSAPGVVRQEDRSRLCRHPRGAQGAGDRRPCRRSTS